MSLGRRDAKKKKRREKIIPKKPQKKGSLTRTMGPERASDHLRTEGWRSSKTILTKGTPNPFTQKVEKRGIPEPAPDRACEAKEGERARIAEKAGENSLEHAWIPRLAN